MARDTERLTRKGHQTCHFLGQQQGGEESACASAVLPPLYPAAPAMSVMDAQVGKWSPRYIEGARTRAGALPGGVWKQSGGSTSALMLPDFHTILVAVAIGNVCKTLSCYVCMTYRPDSNRVNSALSLSLPKPTFFSIERGRIRTPVGFLLLSRVSLKRHTLNVTVTTASAAKRENLQNQHKQK